MTFPLHMTLHMAVVALAAPLLALALAGGRFDPVPRAPRLFAPIPASLVELVVVWGWHAPSLHHAARHDLGALAVEQAMFFASGFLVWMSSFGGHGRARTGAGVLALLLTSMHMTLLGALLALAPRALYHGTLEAQHTGGAIMLVAGGLAYLLGGLALTVRLLRRPA